MEGWSTEALLGALHEAAQKAQGRYIENPKTRERDRWIALQSSAYSCQGKPIAEKTPEPPHETARPALNALQGPQPRNRTFLQQIDSKHTAARKAM